MTANEIKIVHVRFILQIIQVFQGFEKQFSFALLCMLDDSVALLAQTA